MTTQQTALAIDLISKDVTPFTALTFTTQATLQTLEQYNSVPEKLYNEAQRLGVTPTGAIQYIYTDVNGDSGHAFQLSIALPVSDTQGIPNGFTYTTFRSFRCVSYTHVGPWSDFPALYNMLFAQFHREGYKGGSIVREVYTVVDFEDPANCVTEIQISIT
ncbi:GyrI-like domain-containing protein [Spirosoma soli]|uniref:GyrI-like domain-containing protein n=1 Tax=Spirosoma soli TaxID=1770529 RepID=A0ABW5M9V9_9BACT